MTYKYKKIVTQGATGTVLVHKSTEENMIYTLGEIEDFIYILCTELGEQHKELEFIEVNLTDAEKAELKQQRYYRVLKQDARLEIRKIKDFEDDLTDLKKVVQFMARGFAGLWESLPAEMKEANPYKENFNLFSAAIINTEFRLDLESDQVAKIAKILQDEEIFANIFKEKCLDKTGV